MSTFPPLSPEVSSKGTGQGPVFLSGWDRATIGDQPVPGLARITGGASIRLKLDPKDAAGKNGSRPTAHGLEPQEFTLEVRVWTDLQVEALDNVCQKLLPRDGKNPEPVSFDHPSVRLLRINAVQIVGASGLERAEQLGMLKMTFRLRHWMPSGGKKRASATYTGKRKVANVRAAAAAARGNSNPLPSTSKTAAAPKK